MQQFWGLLWKEFTRRRKSCFVVFLQLIFPFLVAAIGFLLLYAIKQGAKGAGLAKPSSGGKPPNDEELEPWKEPHIFLFKEGGQTSAEQWKFEFDDAWFECGKAVAQTLAFVEIVLEKDKESVAEEIKSQALSRMYAMYSEPKGKKVRLSKIGVIVQNISSSDKGRNDLINLTYYLEVSPRTEGHADMAAHLRDMHFTLLARYYKWYNNLYGGLKGVLNDSVSVVGLSRELFEDTDIQQDRNYGAYVAMSFVLMFSLTINLKHILDEKRSKIRDLMHMCGINNFKYYMSYFTLDLPLTILPGFLYVFALLRPPKERVLYYLLVILLYSVSLTLFSIAFTVFFERPLRGVAFYTCIMMVNLFLAFVDPSDILLVLFSLFPPFGCISAMHAMHKTLNAQLDLSLSLFFTTSRKQPLHTPGAVCLCIIASWFLCLIVIFYVGPIWPFQSGSRQPVWFPFKIFLGKLKPRLTEDKTRNNPNFEPDPQNLVAGIEVNSLTKRYGQREAVRDVFLKVYNEQITALLGHNGAGKTTLMSMITGMESVTSGKVLINGVDIDFDPIKARKNIGCCPQVNTMYDNFTVIQHLYLFAMLKRSPCKTVDTEIQRVLTLVKLVDKAKTKSKNLSGGMKRRLQLAMAFIGGSKILILDEPSSGLDVEARRVIWDMLLQIRREYIVFLTTHHMEEADCLGDRIAIMYDGEIKCCGSSLFLKRKFGIGYVLRVSKAATFNLDKCQDFIKSELSTSSFTKETRSEVLFNFTNEDVSKLPNFFDQLAQNKESLGISSCGVTITTMDDVFVRVGETYDEKSSHSPQEGPTLTPLKKPLRPNFCQQFQALILKRWHALKRRVLVRVFLVFTLLLTCIAIFLVAHGSLYFQEIKSSLQKPSTDYKCIGEMDKCEDAFGELKTPANKQASVVNITLVGDTSCFMLRSSEDQMFEDATRTVNGMFKLLTGTKGDMISITAQVAFPPGLVTVTESFMWLFPAAALAACSVFAFVIAYSIVAHEKETEVKTLQLMAGVSPLTYWLAHLCFDMLFALFLLTPVIFLYPILSTVFLTSPLLFNSFGCAASFYAALVILTLASFIVAYYMSTLSLSVSAGMQLYVFHSVPSILVEGMSIGLMNTIRKNKYEFPHIIFFHIFFLVRIILALSPHGALRVVILVLMQYSYELNLCSTFEVVFEDYCNHDVIKPIKDMCCEGRGLFGKAFTLDPIDENLGIYLVGCFAVTLFAGIHLLVKEYQNMGKLSNDQVRILISTPEDSDVAKERVETEALIRTNQHLSKALTVIDLTKQFKTNCAVNRLTFTVEPNQCFGLLGVNGAGKTTTFKMLMGEIRRSAGEAYIGQRSLSQNFKEFRKQIGYCPQFNCFVQGLTAREMLYLFGQIRGIDSSEIDVAVKELIQLVDLQEYASRVAEYYSGGNKRKLSTGIALIGFPKLIFLDEPTAAVDPVARRKIWQTIEYARKTCGSSIILTSHALDECEALCEKIVVMVDGQFKCLGSIQHLKSKYGQGLTITAKLKPNVGSIDTVQKAIMAEVPSAVVRDSHTTTTILHVQDPAVPIGAVYRVMEKVKQQYHLEDYQVAETNLEQIFLRFAKTAYGTKTDI